MASPQRTMRREKERETAKASVILVSIEEILKSVANPERPGVPGSIDILMSKEIPAATSLQIGRTISGVVKELENYHATRKNLCERYANKDKDEKPIMLNKKGEQITDPSLRESGNYDISKEKMSEFNKEHELLMKEIVEVPGQLLRTAQLGNINIEPCYMLNLLWLFVDEQGSQTE